MPVISRRRGDDYDDNQCDQILDYKVAQVSPNLPEK